MKLKNVLLASLAVTALLLANCGGGDTEAPAPSLDFLTGGITSDQKNAKDSMALFRVSASSNDKKLKSITVTLSVNGATAGTIKDTTVTSKSISWNFKTKTDAVVGSTMKYTFTVTDDNGKTASKSITLTTKQAPSTLVRTQNQKIWNINGTTAQIGAYDLNTSANVPAASAPKTKDLLDLTPAATAATFSKSWGSGHGLSRFVRITDINEYINASNTDDLDNLWNTLKATATPTITGLKDNDVILVKTGQTDVVFDIYLILVNTVTDATGTADNILFEYKYWKP